MACETLIRYLLIASATGSVTAEPLFATQAPDSGKPSWGPELHVIEEQRIGAIEGADEYLFGVVAAIAPGLNGEVYIADGQVPVVRAYDRHGRFIRNLGRNGQGPGEYRAVNGLRVLPDGRVAISDMLNARVSVFDSSGDFITSHRVVTNRFSFGILQVDTAGHFYVRTSLNPGFGGDGAEGWVRVSPDGAVLDTVLVPREEQRARSFVLATASGYARPFTVELLSALSPLGHLIVGRNDLYAFEIRRPGLPNLRVSRAFEPLPLARDERTEWEGWARHFEEMVRRSEAGAPGFRTDFSIPGFKPAFSDLIPDSQGRIWVRRYVKAHRRPGPERKPGDTRPRRVWQEPPTFDVFEPNGQFAGTVTLPWDVEFYDARDRRIWGVLRGSLGEHYVVRYSVVSSR